MNREQALKLLPKRQKLLDTIRILIEESMALPKTQGYKRITTVPLLAVAVYKRSPTTTDISRIIEAITITREIFDVVGWRVNYQERSIYAPMTVSYYIQPNLKSALEDLRNAWAGMMPLVQQFMTQTGRQSLAGEMHDRSVLPPSKKRQMKRLTVTADRFATDLEDFFEEIENTVGEETA